MASDHQIRRVFSDLGELFGAEHSEHDDEGAAMVHGLIKRLRKFAKHEQAEQQAKAHADMYGTPGLIREAGTRPPGFRQTDSKTENCSTCRYMGAHGMCDRYDWPVKPNNVCNTWAATRTREASYELGDGRHVYYDDGPSGKETLQDAADLYTVLDELHRTGSPNLENQQSLEILHRLQSGTGLGEMYIGTLRKLLSKHAAAIAKLRRSRDHDGQNMLELASDGPDSRIHNPD